jgi:diguanylate cyclase (GGDEF)-like protein
MAEVRVLLAGNAKSLPTVFKDELSSFGYHVTICDSAIDAIRELNTHGAAILIAAAHLKELSGYQLCCLLKSDELTSALPIVLIDDGDGHRLQLAGLPNLPDLIATKAEAQKDPQGLVKIISKQVLSGKKHGWSSSPTPLALDFDVFQEDPNHVLPTLLDTLLIDKLVSSKIRVLLDKTDPRNVFVDALFSALSSLGRFDFAGIVVATLQNPWASFTGVDGLNQAQFESFLEEIKAKVSLTQELAIDARLKLSPRKDVALGDTRIVTVASEKTGVGLLVIGKFGNNKLSTGEHALINSLKTNMQPLMKLLIAKQEIENLHTREAYFASIDPLTGLYNLEFLVGFLQQQLLFSYRQKLAVAILLIDIDNFAVLNNTYGLNMGDAVLQKLANRLLSTTRSSDLLARYGADEFAVVLPNTDLGGAKVLAEKLRADIEQMNFVEGQPESSPRATVSVGCAQFDMNDLNPETILRDAKHALQQAKESGRNRVAP